MTQIQRQELLKEARATVPPHIRRFIAQEAVRSQVANAKKQYYSTIRFAFNVEEVPPAQPGGPVTAWKYTLARDRLIAFSYGIQDVATSAGFADGYMPSELDTNLITKGDTGGATVEIHGLSLYLSETSDAHLARLIWANTFVDISLDGSNRYRLLGKMGRIPQGGGLYGAGQSLVAPPPLNASSAMVGTLTNGIPASGNYMKLERIRWNPSSKVDSKFQLRFFVPKPLSFTVSKRDAAPGTAPFQPPIKTGDEGTVVDVTCYLHTREIMPRSTQA
jgi:hypothetical protein